MGQPSKAMQVIQEGLRHTNPDQEASVQLTWLMRLVDTSKLLAVYSSEQLHCSLLGTGTVKRLLIINAQTELFSHFQILTKFIL